MDCLPSLCLSESDSLIFWLQRVTVCCNVLQCVAVCCSVLQCVAVCCSVLQCIAVCCSVLQCVAVCCSVLQCVAVCCSVLQCVAMYRSVLQCVAVCCSVSDSLIRVNPCFSVSDTWHDVFLCMSWLIHVSDVPPSHVWHASPLPLVHLSVCDLWHHPTHEWVMSHIWTSHIAHMKYFTHFTHMDELCRTYESFKSYLSVHVND